MSWVCRPRCQSSQLHPWTSGPAIWVCTWRNNEINTALFCTVLLRRKSFVSISELSSVGKRMRRKMCTSQNVTLLCRPLIRFLTRSRARRSKLATGCGVRKTIPFRILVEYLIWKSLSLSVMSNNSVLLIQSSCNRIPVWTLCTIDSWGRITQLNLIRLVAFLLHPFHRCIYKMLRWALRYPFPTSKLFNVQNDSWSVQEWEMTTIFFLVTWL